MDLTACTVSELSALLQQRRTSAHEVAEAHLARIADVDGPHSFDGAPEAINAWSRVYEERALADAARADRRLSGDDAGPLVGVPIGLKDVFGIAGCPLTASSRVIELTPDRDCDIAARLFAHGMVLLGHHHTHEFAAGSTTDQVGNPWDLNVVPGGSSGGSAAALAARTTPAAIGTDTGGSLRIPSALCGTSTIKPTRGALPLRGILPMSHSLDHPGPMARTVRDCALLLHAMLGRDALPELLTLGDGSRQSLTGKRIALSPRMGLVAIDPDVAEGVENAVAAARKLGATIVDPPPPPTALDLNQLFNDIATTDFLAWHAPLLATKRELYRKSTLDLFTYAESQAMTAVEYADGQWQRMESTWAWTDWLEAQRIDAILEPTVPIVASPRRYSHDDVASDDESGARIALTYIWDVTGFPVVSMPSGLGKRSRLPVGVSLVAAAGRELPLLDMGIALQEELGVPEPPTRSEPRPATVL